MAEEPVFWLGGSPAKAKDKGRESPEAEGYESALRDACVACGYDLDEYVTALGGFGGWLANLDRNGKRYRVFWSGKTKRLSFEEAHPGGGWNELGGADVADDGVGNFVAAVKDVLNNQDKDSG